VYDAEANKRDDAIVTWSFGDGMQRTGSSVLHTFYAPGEYAVNVHASTADGGDASASITIAAKDAGIAITAVSPRGITLTNADVSALDLSLWRLRVDGGEFRIPQGTQILGKHTVLFPTQVTELTRTNSGRTALPRRRCCRYLSENWTRCSRATSSKFGKL